MAALATTREAKMPSEAVGPQNEHQVAAWLPGCLDAWMPAWLLGCLAAWLLDCLAAWLLGWLAGLSGCLLSCWPYLLPGLLPAWETPDADAQVCHMVRSSGSAARQPDSCWPASEWEVSEDRCSESHPKRARGQPQMVLHYRVPSWNRFRSFLLEGMWSDSE